VDCGGSLFVRVVSSWVLIIGFAVLLIAGLLRLARDLLGESLFAAPSSPAEEHREIEENRPIGS
jgi:hypothetical protein